MVRQALYVCLHTILCVWAEEEVTTRHKARDTTIAATHGVCVGQVSRGYQPPHGHRSPTEQHVVVIVQVQA